MAADPKPYTISLTAFGTPSGGIAPQFSLSIDNLIVGQGSVGQQDQTYSFSTLLVPNAAHVVAITFTNPGQVNGLNRVLYLKSISVNGEAISTSDPSVVYHSPNYGDFAQRGDMYWGGEVDFNLDASHFSAPTSPPDTTPPTTTPPVTEPPVRSAQATRGSPSRRHRDRGQFSVEAMHILGRSLPSAIPATSR